VEILVKLHLKEPSEGLLEEHGKGCIAGTFRDDKYVELNVEEFKQLKTGDIFSIDATELTLDREDDSFYEFEFYKIL